MAIRIEVENVRPVQFVECVEGDLGEQELALIPSSAQTGAGPNIVLLVSDEPLPTADSLELPLASARLLYRGDLPKSLILRLSHGKEEVDMAVRNEEAGRGVGERALARELAELPDALAQAGHEIMRRVRDASPGFLDRRPASGRFINRPANFFALKVQPRDGSLRFTVYGPPSNYPYSSDLDLIPDQNSYTGFKVTAASQVDAAVDVILKAERLKRSRFSRR